MKHLLSLYFHCADNLQNCSLIPSSIPPTFLSDLPPIPDFDDYVYVTFGKRSDVVKKNFKFYAYLETTSGLIKVGVWLLARYLIDFAEAEGVKPENPEKTLEPWEGTIEKLNYKRITKK